MGKVLLAPGLMVHINRSVADGVRLEELEISDKDLADALRAQYVSGPVKVWGLKSSQEHLWNKVELGDILLSYNSKRFIYSSVVCLKYPSQPSQASVRVAESIAQRVWGRDIQGNTWPYLLFLKDIRQVDISLDKFNELTAYRFNAVQGFLVLKRERSKRLLEELSGLSAPKVVALSEPQKTRAEEPDLHDALVGQLFAIGELIGYKPQRNWSFENYRYDVVWFRPTGRVPRCVFEVQIGGNVSEALGRLKHAYDLWNSLIFLVSTPSQLGKVKTLLAGTFHEIAEETSVVNVSDIEEFYKFKGRFEWLERKFGLRVK